MKKLIFVLFLFVSIFAKSQGVVYTSYYNTFSRYSDVSQTWVELSNTQSKISIEFDDDQNSVTVLSANPKVYYGYGKPRHVSGTTVENDVWDGIEKSCYWRENELLKDAEYRLVRYRSGNFRFDVFYWKDNNYYCLSYWVH